MRSFKPSNHPVALINVVRGHRMDIAQRAALFIFLRGGDVSNIEITALGCDPIAGLARIADEAAGRDDPAERKLAAWCYGELASYIEPKRKAVEHSGEIKTVLPCVPIPGPAPPPVPA